MLASFLGVFALILPFLAGTPFICGIVSMLTRRLDFARSSLRFARVYVAGGGEQFVDISSNFTS